MREGGGRCQRQCSGSLQQFAAVHLAVSPNGIAWSVYCGAELARQWDGRGVHLRSRGMGCPSVKRRTPPSVTVEGAGRLDAPSHPRPACNKKTPQVRRKHRHSLRNGLRLIRALLGAPCSLATVTRAAPPGRAGLTPASGGRDHTILPSASVALVSRSRKRPSLPASTCVTTRPPLFGRAGMSATNHRLPKNGRRIFCAGGLDLRRRRFR